MALAEWLPALLLGFCAKFALRVTTGGGDHKQVAESLHAPSCLGTSPPAQQNMYIYGKPTKS